MKAIVCEAFDGPGVYAEVMREIMRLGSGGRLRPYISHHFPLERAAEAMQAIIDRKLISKAVLVG